MKTAPAPKNQARQKGQSFASFELLVAAIMALALLAIIVGLITYFDSLSTQASFRALEDAMKSAANSPTNETVKAENILLPSGTISAVTLGNWANLNPRCFTLQSGNPQVFETISTISSSGETIYAIEIKKRVATTVNIACTLSGEYSPSSDCEKSCIVSIGKSLANPA